MGVQANERARCGCASSVLDLTPVNRRVMVGLARQFCLRLLWLESSGSGASGRLPLGQLEAIRPLVAVVEVLPAGAVVFSGQQESRRRVT